MICFALFLLFAHTSCDRYDSQVIQDVFQKIEAKALENRITVDK